ncbi:unnamed protein product [Caenorhabditis auriculariae]|uniref:Adenylate kinase isoenzyme 6 homolog n=1 Tax=Caenorhabditis auriculariae TaxID=2777116 RepID=A0A8S1HAJ1_9PELO|nr:unnamed protein product [Caenorhabditis auriculariae]
MSRRKLKLVEYDRDYIDYEDDDAIRRFVATLEETHLKRRHEDWSAALLDEKDDAKWKAEIDKYIEELGIPKDRSRKIVVDQLLNISIEQLYKGNENATSLTTSEYRKRAKSLFEKHQNSQNPLNRIDYETPEFAEKVRALCELLGISKHPDPIVSLKAACIYISNNLSDESLRALNEDTKKALKMMDIKSFPLGIPQHKLAPVNMAARILRLVNVEQLRAVQTKINETLVAVQDVTIDMSKKAEFGPSPVRPQLISPMGTPESRSRPNILITGSPGTGKSTLAKEVADKLGFDLIDVSKEVTQNNLHSAYDNEYGCHVLDEEKLLDHIQDRMDDDRGGVVVDYHGCDFFPERWFDIVAVLRCDNGILYDRLAARGYTDFKIRENIECEIFGSLLEEARDSYKVEVIHELRSETPDEMESNITKICELVEAFKA